MICLVTVTWACCVLQIPYLRIWSLSECCRCNNYCLRHWVLTHGRARGPFSYTRQLSECKRKETFANRETVNEIISNQWKIKQIISKMLALFTKEHLRVEQKTNKLISHVPWNWTVANVMEGQCCYFCVSSSTPRFMVDL